MSFKEALIEQLKRHEGVVMEHGRHILYYDSIGVATIGWGRNLEDKGLADDEAEFLLANDIDDVLRDCETLFFWDGLDDVRRQVIANMVFNMGLNGVLGFNNMIAAIDRKDYDRAAKEMLDSKWAKQVGSRATELSEMMKSG